MKTVAIHQPNYIPWAGYFYKMLKADIFVVLDDVLHSKSSYTNRVNIKTPNGVKRLTVPLAKKEIPINELPISKDRKWQAKHIKLIHDSYCKASFFNDYYDSIEAHYDNKPWEYLSKLNIELIRMLRDFFEIDTKLIKSSDLAIVEQEKNQRNLDICKELGAQIYLSDDGGGVEDGETQDDVGEL
mgnify:CR=1 FL=1